MQHCTMLRALGNSVSSCGSLMHRLHIHAGPQGMSTASFGMSGFGESRSRTASWSVRDVCLADVARRQDWGSLLAIWVVIGSLAVAWTTQVITLTERSFLVYDSTLAFKYK